MSARSLLRGVTLAALLVATANTHKSAHAEALARQVPAGRLAPILDPLLVIQSEHVREVLDSDGQPTGKYQTLDGRRVSTSSAHHLVNHLRWRIAHGEIPAPEGIGLQKLFHVAQGLQRLNLRELGIFAGLAYLSRALDVSPSQIRAVCSYLALHGHALLHSRSRNEARQIAGAQRPCTDTRTTIRQLFVLTCDQQETLSEAEVIDRIALGERDVKVLEQLDLPGVENPPPFVPERLRAGKPCAANVPTPELDLETLAPELRCLVAPLADLASLTGYLLPVVWTADEGERAGLVDANQEPDLERVAGALRELAEKIREERRDADAMGAPHPRLRGGAAGLQQRVRARCRWWAEHPDAAVYRARDEARAREESYEAGLSPEVRDRRGLAPEPSVPRPAARPAPAAPPAPSARLTVAERAIMILRNRIAALAPQIALAGSQAERAKLETERAKLETELLRGLGAPSQPAGSTGPPE